MKTLEQTEERRAGESSIPNTPPEDNIAEQLRAADTEEERASILASCIGETVGKFSSLRLTELDIKNNPIYRHVKAMLEG